MTATYVNNLRIAEPGNGDANWGTTTNASLEIIGEALGIGSEGITTNANTHTSTVADGASDQARAFHLKYTGTLDSACTITIAPNTMKRVQIIENATSGGHSIIISQGSGANVTILNGTKRIVSLDGAGSGAAVVDVTAAAFGSQAFYVPAGTTGNRPTGVAGAFRYNSSTSEFEGYTSSWGSIGGSGATNVSLTEATGNGSTTAFTLSTAPGTENNTQVYIDGVYQEKGTYAVSGSTLTFSTAPPSGTSVEVTGFTESSVGTPGDGTVTLAKMAANSVDSPQYVDGSIDTVHIANSQITVGKMAVNSVDSDQYVDGSIDTVHIADDQVTGAKLANNIDIAGTLDVTGLLTADAGVTIVGALTLGGTAVTSTAAEINYLDIATLGLTAASKAVTADANGVVTNDGGISEEYTAVTSSSAAVSLNLRLGNHFSHDLTENTTVSFANPAASGKVSGATLRIIQGSTARTITWNSSIKWAGDTAPTLSTGDNDVDVFVFYTVDAGTNYYGFTAGQDMS